MNTTGRRLLRIQVDGNLVLERKTSPDNVLFLPSEEIALIEKTLPVWVIESTVNESTFGKTKAWAMVACGIERVQV